MIEFSLLKLVLLVASFYALTFACCSKKKSKRKHPRRKSASKERRHKKRPQPSMPVAVVQPPAIKSEPLAGMSKSTEEAPMKTAVQPTEKEDKESKKEKKKDGDDEASVEFLTRCRDYTPDGLKNLEHLFDLLV